MIILQWQAAILRDVMKIAPCVQYAGGALKIN
jgi:hypothetical protein